MTSDSEIRMLRQQLAENEEKLRLLRKQVQKTIEAENQRLTQEIQSSIMQTYQNYQAAFAAETERLQTLHAQETALLQNQYAELLKRQQLLEQETAGKQAELEKLLHELREESTHQNTRSAHEADTACKRLEAACERVRRSAAERFFPHKLRIYVDALRHAKDLMMQKLYPQAQAAADSGLLGIKRLENDTERKQNEFHHAVLLYQAVYSDIFRLLQSDSVHQTPWQSQRLSGQQIDFWSDGLYSELLKELSEHYALLKEVTADETKWLCETCFAADAVQFIRQKTAKLEQLPDLFVIALNAAFSSFLCFENSRKIQNLANSCLTEQNFQFIGTDYGSMPKDQNAAQLLQMYGNGQKLPSAIHAGDIPDLREERRLRWNHAGETAILHLYPVRQEDRFLNRIELEVQTPHDPHPLYHCLTRLLSSHDIRVEDTITGEDYAHCRLNAAGARELLARRNQDMTSQSSVPAWSTDEL